MGARSFESDLRRRLLWLVLPTIVGVAAASVAVTWHALQVADVASARFKAEALLVAFDTELAEGDEPNAAAEEVLREAEAEGLHGSLHGGTVADATTPHLPPPAIAKLHAGQCELVHDADGWWRGCRVARGSYEAVVALPVTSHVDVVRTLAEAMALVVLATLGGTLIAARAAMRKPLASVRALVDWSEQVVASTDSPPPAPRATTEELQRLTGSLQALVERLTNALGRERATSAHIAHELRTPLTALRAELEALGDARARHLLGDVDKLGRVIDAILLLASPARAGPSGVVVNVADLARSLAPEKAKVDAPDEALIDADERLVELALVNLLENACAHGGGPASAIRVTRVERGVRVAVIDEGAGVDRDVLEHLFERHWRGPGSRGAGLGLALVHAVALRYDGEVDAVPNATGKGLEVAITFGRMLGWQPPS